MNTNKIKLIDKIILAHQATSNHRISILNSEICGCFFCFATFHYDEIHTWWDYEQTAECPKCLHASVIGSASGFPIEDSFLKSMHGYLLK